MVVSRGACKSRYHCICKETAAPELASDVQKGDTPPRAEGTPVPAFLFGLLLLLLLLLQLLLRMEIYESIWIQQSKSSRECATKCCSASHSTNASTLVNQGLIFPTSHLEIQTNHLANAKEAFGYSESLFHFPSSPGEHNFNRLATGNPTDHELVWWLMSWGHTV